MTRCVALILILVIPALAQAERVFRWVDDEGVVHFSNEPPPEGAEQLDLPQEARPLTAPPLKQPEQQAQPATEKQAEQVAQNDASREPEVDREQICAQAQAAVEELTPNRRISVLNPDGSREWLMGESRVAKLEEMQVLADEYCD